LEILRRAGVLKAKIFKGMYEPKLEFPEGMGVQTKKTLCGGSMDINFSGTTHIIRVQLCNKLFFISLTA